MGILPAPYRKTLDVWADVRAGATQMLKALSAFDDSHYHRLEPYFNELKYKLVQSEKSPRELRYLLRLIERGNTNAGLHELLFDYLWNALELVRQTVTVADANAGQPTAQTKVDQSIARSFVYHVGDAHCKAFGKLPPTSESGWFVPFVCELPKALGIEITFGAELASERLKELKRGRLLANER